VVSVCTTRSRLLFGWWQVWISAGTTAASTETFLSFQFPQANSGILHRFSQGRLLTDPSGFTLRLLILPFESGYWQKREIKHKIHASFPLLMDIAGSCTLVYRSVTDITCPKHMWLASALWVAQKVMEVGNTFQLNFGPFKWLESISSTRITAPGSLQSLTTNQLREITSRCVLKIQ
jgi:hypothetical protein